MANGTDYNDHNLCTWDGSAFQKDQLAGDEALKEAKVKYYSGTIFGEDGNDYGLCQFYPGNADELTEKAKKTDNPEAYLKKNLKKNKVKLCKFEGNKLSFIKGDKYLFDPETLTSAYRTQILEDGSIVVAISGEPSKVVRYKQDGTLIREYKEAEGTFGLKVLGDCMYVCVKNKIRILSLTTGELLSAIDIDDQTHMVSFCRDENDDVYMACGDGVFLIKEDLKTVEKLFSGDRFTISVVSSDFRIQDMGVRDGKVYITMDTPEKAYVYCCQQK